MKIHSDLSSRTPEIDADAEWIGDKADQFFATVSDLKQQAKEEAALEHEAETAPWLEASGEGREELWPALFEVVGLHCWEEMHFPSVVVRKHSLSNKHRVIVYEYHNFQIEHFRRATIAVVNHVPSPASPMRFFYSS